MLETQRHQLFLKQKHSFPTLPKGPSLSKPCTLKPRLNLDCELINDNAELTKNAPLPPTHRHTRSYGRLFPSKHSIPKPTHTKNYSPAITPSKALLEMHEKLSSYEIKEITHFKEVYFLGSDHKEKENSFIDKDGYYKIHIGDHIVYRYEILEELGQGSFGTVIRCKDHKMNEEVAIKILRKNQRILRFGRREAEVLDLLSKDKEEASSCIVEKLGEFYFREHLCIIFELLQINLYEFLKKNHFHGLASNLARRITTQILIALKHSHGLGVIHSDIKPENIVFRQENKSGIKVIDFGSTCTIGETCHSYIQSRFYRAPEVILQSEYKESIDIWSLGCVVVEMVTGWPLFAGNDEREVLKLIINTIGLPDRQVLLNANRKDKFCSMDLNLCERGKRLDNVNNLDYVLEGFDNKLIDFVKKCIQWDGKKRITAEEALLHPWIKGEHLVSIA